MKSNNPLVSVVVATYRRTESLRDAIDSACNQTYENTEIVVVDDNADDRWNRQVFEVLKDFLDNEKIVYIKNEQNMGSAETRNIGIRIAKGEYITFLDDDDVYLPEKIEKQIEHMQKAEADYSITDLILYRENGKIEEIRKRDFIQKTDKKSLLMYHLKYHITGTDTMMFKKTYLEEINYFDKIDVGDEFYLMVKAINHGGVFAYLPVCDVKAYVHTGEGGLSSGKTKIDGENKLHEYKKKFFDELDRGTVRYIKMRHHAVLAFAYLRMGKYGGAIGQGLKSICYAPIECVKMILKRN